MYFSIEANELYNRLPWIENIHMYIYEFCEWFKDKWYFSLNVKVHKQKTNVLIPYTHTHTNILLKRKKKNLFV